MFDDREVCGTCKWHWHTNDSDDWSCNNMDSENYGEWTEYEDACEDWEERD